MKNKPRQHDTFLGLFDQVKPGDPISFCTGPGDFPTLPAFSGIVYGKGETRWGRYVRVKVTDEHGDVRFEHVNGFAERGIGAYYKPGQLVSIGHYDVKGQ